MMWVQPHLGISPPKGRHDACVLAKPQICRYKAMRCHVSAVVACWQHTWCHPLFQQVSSEVVITGMPLASPCYLQQAVA